MRFALTFLCLSGLFLQTWQICNRKPQGSSGDVTPPADDFQVLISGNLDNYVPSQTYTISIACTTFAKFLTFTLVVENENGTISGEEYVGHFELIDSTETKFSHNCENMVESTNINTKSRIDVIWVAPPSTDSGCLLIRAAVLEQRNVWYMDDGLLTKRVCPEVNEMYSQTTPLDPCCAQDEAKYELKLERSWSRNTHAKYFPTEAWRTRFSDLVGASHSYNFRFWDVGVLASDGMRELAEHGATKRLEQEIKDGLVTAEVRTIIRAPGIAHRNNVMGTTLANARVDSEHHLISLVTKIEPSPDWVLGVAGLELCLPNCTWIEQLEIKLYPWDIGTDSGPSYESADQAQVPPDVIRRITQNFPSDHRSPFYDTTSITMKPLATLYVTRKKVYTLTNERSESESMECATHPWTSWSECSTVCGTGTQSRWRAYKEPRSAQSFNCNEVLNQTQSCVGNLCGIQENRNFISKSSAECELSRWSQWSECSNNCGKGYATRTRSYLNTYARDKCQRQIPIQLEQTRTCMGENCGGSISNKYDSNNDNQPVLFGNTVEEDTNMENSNNENDETEGNAFNFNDFDSQRNRGRRPNTHEESVQNSEDVLNERNTFGRNRNKFTEDDLNERNSFGRNHNTFVENELNERNTYGRNRNKFSENDLNELNTFGRNRNTFSRDPNYDNEQTYQLPPSERLHGISLKPGGGKIGFEQYESNLGNKDESSDDFNLVQNFCLEMPVLSIEQCFQSPVLYKNYWFYDANDFMCKLFTTNNCDTNRNKFTKLENCESTCQNPHLQSQEEQPYNENQNLYNFGEPQSQIKPNYRKKTNKFAERRSFYKN